jgi:NAD(P)-dependent dehydrogenase (short-subunit alcohol dehydrogenase family)
MPPRDLHGKRVLLTGASSGVGAAAAKAFAAAGADVALLARNAPGLEAMARVVREHGARALVLPVDVADRPAVEAAVARVVAEWGGIDVAVSNAASMVFGPFTQVTPEDFDRTVAVTFTGAVNVIRAVLPVLERSAGGLVVVSSVNSRAPLPTFSAYAAAKHALRGFLGTLRIELSVQRSPVTVSMLSPGAIDTPIWRNVTSATGFLPRSPPEGYKPETIAAGIVDLARRPRNEVTIGLEGKLFQVVWRVPPISTVVLKLVYRYYLSGRKPATRRPLWEPTGDGSFDGPAMGRPSLTRRLRFALPALRTPRG